MCIYKLIIPNKEFINEIIEFKKEVESFECDYKFEGCAGLENFDDINDWIKKIQMYSSKDTCPEGFVPSSLYLYVRENDNRVVGIIDIRHHINHPVLSLWGGHIGYSVRPSERRKGIGSLMLKDALIKCKGLGNNKILITCNKGNVGSEKVILNNGGIFESEVDNNGTIVKRFWINL